jgi:uncharacterized protein YjbI with pentapeptide repeats
MQRSEHPRFKGDRDHLVRIMDAASKADVQGWNAWRARYDGWVNLEGVDLPGASLEGFIFSKTHLERANLAAAHLSGASFRYACLDGALLEEAKLFNANLEEAQCPDAQMRRAQLRHADITAANFKNARLQFANLELTEGEDALFDGAHLLRAKFRNARLPFSKFRNADLTEADFHNANLHGCDLHGADLTRSYLVGARISGAKLQGATLRGCEVYGLSAWDVEVDDTTTQADLVASPPRMGEAEPIVRVDDIEIAQFINLIMSHGRIRKVISATIRNCVLLLGRFREDRRPVLDALAGCVKEHHLIPIIFDFPRPAERDLMETVTILAGLSSFIVADITCPRSVTQETQAIVPNFMVPFVPILQRGEEPFPTFRSLALRHNDWVLPCLVYDSVETLRAAFPELILKKAKQRETDLVAQRAAQPETIDAKAYLMRTQ